jgi:hypothetical protein
MKLETLGSAGMATEFTPDFRNGFNGTVIGLPN